MVESPSLSDLMVQAQQGDQKSYGRLLETITPMIQSYLRKRLSNAEDVEDITQNTLMAIHKSRHTYQPGQPFENWMYGIAKFKMIDGLRKLYKKGEHEVKTPDHIETFFGDETNMSGKEAKEDLNTLLQELPEKQRKIIYLQKIEGHSVAEIAEKMDMSVSNVKVTSHRAMQKLQDIAKAQEA